jgi:hypothetical protein
VRESPLRGWREELEFVPVGIFEVERGARHPAMEDRAAGRYPAFAEGGHSLLEARPGSREREMVARKLASLLLEGIATS